MSSPDASAAAAAAPEAAAAEPVKDKAYWKARRESANKLPPHPCAELQARSLACASAAGDLKYEVCAERFRAYKECLQETVRAAAHAPPLARQSSEGDPCAHHY